MEVKRLDVVKNAKSVTFAADVHEEEADEEKDSRLHQRRYSETGRIVRRDVTKENAEMPLTLSFLRSESTSDIPNALSKKSAKRRFSLMNIFAGKSTLSLNSSIEETDSLEDETAFNAHNERLLISFADIYGGNDGECHDNRVFQSDQPEIEHTVSGFGKKGKAQGDYQDAKDIAILSGNRLLITDFINGRLQLCNTSGRLLLMYTGTDVAEPWGASCIDHKCVALTSRKSKCVRVLDLDGEVTKTFGENFFTSPTGITVDSQGNFIVCDEGANTVSIHDKDGHFVQYVGDPKTPEGSFTRPRYVCLSETGDIIVSDSGNHKIKIFTADGEFIRSFGSFGRGDRQLKSPYGVCTNKIGDIFVADHYNSRVSMFTSCGVFIRHLVTSEHGLRHPQGLALKAGQTLFITHGDLKASEVLVYRMNSGHVTNNEDHTIICHL